jgi:hypothetical protein
MPRLQRDRALRTPGPAKVHLHHLQWERKAHRLFNLVQRGGQMSPQAALVIMVFAVLALYLDGLWREQ